MTILSKDPFGILESTSNFRLEVQMHLQSEDDVNKTVFSFRQASLCQLLINYTPNLNHSSCLKGFIYDILNSVVAIIKKRERYLQLNFRSMVEHIARLSLDKSYNGGEFDLTVRTKDFIHLKQTVQDENWSYLHNVYINACHYVHSSPEANLNFAAKFISLMTGDCNSTQGNMVKNLFKVVSELMRIIIKHYHIHISDIFYRNAKDLEKIMGKSLHKHYLTYF
ncbi:TPA: hypothetical protein ACV1O4_004570 [Yersinia enterocolitica]|uniref:hypothetical protein n=1 Tax=Yersinia TaxID=629 RepID=UPI0021BDCAEF|nr:hypothetical protein [Yersinia bercovieri]